MTLTITDYSVGKAEEKSQVLWIDGNIPHPMRIQGGEFSMFYFMQLGTLTENAMWTQNSSRNCFG